MRFLTTNYCTESATTVTASSANSNFPVSNLKHPFRSKRWRSTATTSEWVKFDFQTTETIDSVVILWPKEDGIRLSDSAVIKVQANATNVWTSPAVDQVLTIDNTYMLASHYFTTDQSYRYWRVVVEDAGNPYDFVELGVIWIGKSLALENCQNGFKLILRDLSKTQTTDFGHEYVDEYPLSASLEFTYAYLEYDSVEVLENAYRTNGTRKPVLVALDAEETRFNKDHFTVYGKLSSAFTTGHFAGGLLSPDTIRVEELA